MNRTFLLLLPLSLAPLAVRAQSTLSPLEASPQVLASRGAAALTLRLPPGVIPPSGARIGIFPAGSNARLAELSRPFTPSNNGLQVTLSLDAEPGLYDIRLLRGDKSRAPLTQSARVSVAGIEREPGWWLFNGSPVLLAPAEPTVGAPFFWPGLKRSLSKSARARTFTARSTAPISWRTLAFPPLSAWLSNANAARQAALESARAARSAGGFVGCAMLAAPAQDLGTAGARISAEDARLLSEMEPTAMVSAAQAARATCAAIAPDAALILSIGSLSPTLAARVVDLAAPECDAVYLAGFDSSDAASLWPLKAARRVAEEQPEFDLPIFVSPRDEAGAVEAWMSGATGVVQDGPQLLAGGSSQILESNLGLLVGSVTLEDSGLLRAGDALSLFRRLRDIGRVPLLARTYEAAGRRDRSSREGRRTAEPFAIRWTRGTPSADLLAAIRDATRDGSRVYFEGSPFPIGAENRAAPATPAFDAQGWGNVLQSGVRAAANPAGAASAGVASAGVDDYSADAGELQTADAAARTGASVGEMKLEDVWTFGLARGQSVPVEQSIIATPSSTPSPAELGDVAAPKGQSERDRERMRPAPRVVARLGDGSVGTLISPSGASVRRDDSGSALPRGEVVWTPHLIPARNEANAARLSAYDASISTLLQPALVRLFERAPGGASDEAGSDGAVPLLRTAVGVRVSVRATTRGTLMLALINAEDRPRALSLQTQAAGGYAVDLATNRVLSTRTRALRVELDVDVPARGFRLLALSKDALSFATDRDTRRLKVKAR